MKPRTRTACKFGYEAKLQRVLIGCNDVHRATFLITYCEPAKAPNGHLLNNSWTLAICYPSGELMGLGFQTLAELTRFLSMEATKMNRRRGPNGLTWSKTRQAARQSRR